MISTNEPTGIHTHVVSVGLRVQLLWDKFLCCKHVCVKTAERASI